MGGRIDKGLHKRFIRGRKVSKASQNGKEKKYGNQPWADPFLGFQVPSLYKEKKEKDIYQKANHHQKVQNATKMLTKEGKLFRERTAFEIPRNSKDGSEG